jgi:hypothetical protein
VLSLDDAVIETLHGPDWAVAAKSLHSTACHDKAPFDALGGFGRFGELHRMYRIAFEDEYSKQKARLMGGPKLPGKIRS